MPTCDGWRLGLKALAIYRDGSKESQPLSTSTEADKAKDKETARPRRERLPDTRRSVTHKFNVAGHEGYITVGLYDDGRPGELFITMAKEGSTVGGLMDCFGTAISMSLQYGVPLEVLVNKFSHTRFEPMGHTKNPDMRIAKSMVDYIFRWLGITFLPGYREANLGLPSADSGEAVGIDPVAIDTASELPPPSEPPRTKVAEPFAAVVTSPSSSASRNGHAALQNGNASEAMLERAGAAMGAETAASGGGRTEQFASFQSDAPSCDNCGAITVRNGNCYLCHNCGNSMGCS